MFNCLSKFGWLFACVAITTTGCGRTLSSVASNTAVSVVDRVVAQPDSTVELLESELRWMEDNLYRMDDQLDDALAQLKSAKRNNAILRLELVEARKQIEPEPSDTGSDGSDGLGDLQIHTSPPQVRVTEEGAKREPTLAEPRAGYDEETSDLGPESPYGLDIEFGAPAAATPGTSDDGESPSEADGEIKIEDLPDPTLLPPNTDSPATNPFEPEDGEDASEAGVTRIKLNPQLTGGYSFDGEPGHEGIIVVIEPQDSFARYIPLAGDVTVEVFDSTKTGLDSRVGKWRLNADESHALMKTTLMGKGVHLQLPWPGAPPQNRRLDLVVKYALPNGKQLEASRLILVEPLTSALVAKASQAEEKDWSPYRPSLTPASKSAEESKVSRRETPWFPKR